MNYLIFDFEVFKYDTLLGVYDINNKQYIQLWDKDDIINYYKQNINSIWIGHNNSEYDNYILQAIINNQSPYLVSQDIVSNRKRFYLNIKLNYYDLMSWHFGSLKVIEAQMGKNISESEVDFNIDRPLTEEERKLTESYNRDDLDQTFLDLQLCKDEFQLRLDLIKEFHLPLDALHYTQTQIAEKALGAIKNDNLINIPVHPAIYPTMRINNKIAREFYLNEGFRNNEKPVTTICDLEHQMGAGGMHAAKEKCKYDWALYLDVSGYYNLIMIKYNLLSRAIPDEGKKLYEFMYHQQLALKSVNDSKRAVYKIILLAVFGAQMNEYCKFYDPWNGSLVPVVGQMFLIDLLEKLEGKIDLIQSNTDGIMVKPLVDESIVLDIVKEWCDRTGLTIKPKKIYDIVQRDVNNYMYRDENGKIHTKGEAVKYYNNWDNPFSGNSYNTTTPYIIHHCIVEYYMNHRLPEEIVEENKTNLRMFQYIVKPLTYDYLTFESDDNIIRLQKVNRCFASKLPGMIYKNKTNKHDKYQNLPDSIFVYNNEILSQKTVNELINKIDYNYYIKRAYERIAEFKKDHEQLSLF